MQIAAKIILPLLLEMKTTKNAEEISYLNDALLQLIRRTEVMLKPLASEGAIALYKSIRKRGDIRKLSWKDVSATRGLRGKFSFEHFVPVNTMRSQLIALKNPSVDQIQKILDEGKIVWVTTAENDRLSKNGFRCNRPNPAEAYKACSIVIAE